MNIIRAVQSPHRRLGPTHKRRHRTRDQRIPPHQKIRHKRVIPTTQPIRPARTLKPRRPPQPHILPHPRSPPEPGKEKQQPNHHHPHNDRIPHNLSLKEGLRPPDRGPAQPAELCDFGQSHHPTTPRRQHHQPPTAHTQPAGQRSGSPSTPPCTCTLPAVPYQPAVSSPTRKGDQHRGQLPPNIPKTTPNPVAEPPPRGRAHARPVAHPPPSGRASSRASLRPGHLLAARWIRRPRQPQ